MLPSNLEYASESYSGVGGMSIYVGWIIKAVGVDDEVSLSGTEVEYVVDVAGEGGHITRHYGCRAVEGFGDPANFEDVIYQPATAFNSLGRDREATGKPVDQFNPPQLKNCAMVLVGFIRGIKMSPIIIGALRHPAIRQFKPEEVRTPYEGLYGAADRDNTVKQLPLALPGLTARDVAASGDSISRMLSEFNGIRWSIDKDGDLIVMNLGPRSQRDRLAVDPSRTPTFLRLHKDGSFIVMDGADQEIKVDPNARKIELTDNNGQTVVIDSMNKRVTVTGAAVNVMAKETLLLSGGNIQIASSSIDFLT